MTIFKPRGPERFKHQRRGLVNIIKSKGVHALLYDPGTGKTATTLDYASILALKSPTGEARVLVIAPLAAIDTWVGQSLTYVADGVDIWAEALGGSIRQRAQALASRGGRPFKDSSSARAKSPRAHGWRRAVDVQTRIAGVEGVGNPHGPDSLTGEHKLILCAVNIDSFKSRAALHPGSSRTVTDYVLEAVKRFQPDLIVVDESHKIKSASSNSSRAIARAGKLSRRRIILTGTVMPHGPMDVYGQWRFLNPLAFKVRDRYGDDRAMNFSQFKSRYAVLGGWMGKEIVSYQNLDEMQNVMSLNSTVAKKEEALDLPKTTDVIVPVTLSPAEAKAYNDMKHDLAIEFADADATVPNMLAQMMRLRQITSGYVADDNGDIRQIGFSKVKTIKSLVEDTLAGESRIVIFSNFRHEITALQDHLAAKGTEILTVTGDTHADDRLKMRQRFGSDDPARLVMIAQVKTMSLAVNELVTASHAIFGSLSMERDDYIQSRDRLDRLGQKLPVTFWYAIVPGSIDSVIMKSHQDRTNLENAILAHISEVEDIL